MSPNEIQLLQTFLAQLVATQAQGKDTQAQAMITDAVSKQADAAYLLVQRSLLLEQAVANAQNQIRQLQAENAKLKNGRTSGSGSFLQPAANAWGNSVNSPPLTTSAIPTSVTGAPLNTAATAANMASPTVQNIAPASSFFGSSTGNMLGTVAATAAGVAAGAFLFQGIGNLLGSGHHSPVTDGAASLNPADSGLLPSYFDSDQTSAPAKAETSDIASAADTDSLDDYADSSDFDDA
ncbi:DUF2076 domain-containing protein [Undibacterium sp. Rencai35W]|uniref:DUF2076 domain-containing protein n=1 Tax=Undibacterium sp. Rencai35W TaxID=3413046 RepID=UPI003BF19B5A